MAKKKSIRVDFVKSCITYNKLNTIAKIAISDMQSFGNPITLPVEHRSSLPSYGATLTDVAEYVTRIDRKKENMRLRSLCL